MDKIYRCMLLLCLIGLTPGAIGQGCNEGKIPAKHEITQTFFDRLLRRCRYIKNILKIYKCKEFYKQTIAKKL